MTKLLNLPNKFLALGDWPCCSSHLFLNVLAINHLQYFSSQAKRLLCKRLNVPASLAADRSSRESGWPSETLIVRRWQWLKNGCVWHTVRERLLHIKGEDEREASKWQDTKLIPGKLQCNNSTKPGNFRKCEHSVLLCNYVVCAPVSWLKFFRVKESSAAARFISSFRLCVLVHLDLTKALNGRHFLGLLLHFMLCLLQKLTLSLSPPNPAPLLWGSP